MVRRPNPESGQGFRPVHVVLLRTPVVFVFLSGFATTASEPGAWHIGTCTEAHPTVAGSLPVHVPADVDFSRSQGPVVSERDGVGGQPPRV